MPCRAVRSSHTCRSLSIFGSRSVSSQHRCCHRAHRTLSTECAPSTRVLLWQLRQHLRATVVLCEQQKACGGTGPSDISKWDAKRVAEWLAYAVGLPELQEWAQAANLDGAQLAAVHTGKLQLHGGVEWDLEIILASLARRMRQGHWASLDDDSDADTVAPTIQDRRKIFPGNLYGKSKRLSRSISRTISRTAQARLSLKPQMSVTSSEILRGSDTPLGLVLAEDEEEEE